MNQSETATSQETAWFAIKTRQDFRAEEVLRPLCEEVFFPTRAVVSESKKTLTKAVIPHVLFIKTTLDNALRLEQDGRKALSLPVSFWIYRYPADNEIQIIPQTSIDLLKLLTSDDGSGCEIFSRSNFKEKDHVRITGGIYKGYDGYVQRVRKNCHVIVKIEGVCLVMLPYIHPDLLERID